MWSILVGSAGLGLSSEPNVTRLYSSALLFQEIEAGPLQPTAASQTDVRRRTTVKAAAPATCTANEPASAAVVIQNTATVLKGQTHKDQALGETFVHWFYNLVNSQNPTHSVHPGDFGPHHFWENCTLKLVSRTPDMSEEEFEGSWLVAQRFLALAREELLVFNPNVSAEGVKVTSDPHGLLIVMACGTIHQHNNCLGVFQQMFGLVRSTLDDSTWKIKSSQLQLSSSQVTAIPKLTDSSANQLLLESGSLAMVPHVRKV